MILNCTAIDDDILSLAILKKHCSKVPCIELNAAFTSPTEGITHLKSNKPDIVFLDINMPGMSGISIARELDEHIVIIFTTAHKDFAFEGFQLNAADYLLKPIDFDRFYQAVCKARDRVELEKIKHDHYHDEDGYIIIKADYKKIKINLSHILYIEALDNYVKIHTQKKTYVTLQNLKSIGEQLDEKNFMRVHKSYIVSLPVIDYFSREHIHINGLTIPVGRAYAKNFISRLQD
ncbi:LytR/AlgR family response regulator transcription factor [Alkaliflexus imshenetskii]|uniref:LytR/AlgR family response regulator transcription factor n=1 Tax=Alkaliflexus imshenetskii TaxID=286730 RepID=UPI0004AC588F|nr:LytTR family DNA-binding domain-containing protein [Alkaliflexus imshenetskii]